MMSPQQYKTVSQWFERLGLVVVGSLVIQKVLGGAALSDPVVILGVVVTFMAYGFGYGLLLKS